MCMCAICENRYVGIKQLHCINCPNVKEIPYIHGLEELYITDCSKLTSIPNIEGLKELYCNNCPNLTSIPKIEGLKKLCCYGCPNLTSIPNIKELNCSSCPWIPYQNDDFKDNIKKLIILQRWFKKYFKIKVAQRYIKTKEFNEWFYSPNNFGGYKHKLRMTKFLKIK